MASSSQSPYGYRGYQGYPYVNPMVNDVPTLDPERAARWANLPRRPMLAGPSRPNAGSSGGANSSQAAQRPKTPSNDTVPPKVDPDENPVVYIDLPEAGSEVSQSIVTEEEEEPEFVQNTIMYDPFENRRIDMPKEDAVSVASSDSGSTAHSPQYPSGRPMPSRPNTLNIAGAGSSSQSPSSSNRQPTIPSFMSKESQVYSGDGSDGFPLSPIPISEFPEPPPAYSEVDITSPQQPVREQPRVEAPPPPRTQVIVNDPLRGTAAQVSPVHTSPVHIHGSPITPMPIMGPINYERKNLICHHCGARVHTVVEKEAGMLTHFLACLFLFIFLPFVIFIYLADYFKYKNHYCPNCRQLIGYETPIVGQKVNYVT